MGYFQNATKRITLPSDENYWVELATDFKYGELKKFSTIDASGNVDFALAGDVFLTSAIKSWNLDNEAGEIVPINQENIDLLTKEDALFLIQEASGVIEEDTKKKTSTK